MIFQIILNLLADTDICDTCIIKHVFVSIKNEYLDIHIFYSRIFIKLLIVPVTDFICGYPQVGICCHPYL